MQIGATVTLIHTSNIIMSNKKSKKSPGRESASDKGEKFKQPKIPYKLVGDSNAASSSGSGAGSGPTGGSGPSSDSDPGLMEASRSGKRAPDSPAKGQAPPKVYVTNPVGVQEMQDTGEDEVIESNLAAQSKQIEEVFINEKVEDVISMEETPAAIMDLQATALRHQASIKCTQKDLREVDERQGEMEYNLQALADNQTKFCKVDAFEKMVLNVFDDQIMPKLVTVENVSDIVLKKMREQMPGIARGCHELVNKDLGTTFDGKWDERFNARFGDFGELGSFEAWCDAEWRKIKAEEKEEWENEKKERKKEMKDLGENFISDKVEQLIEKFKQTIIARIEQQEIVNRATQQACEVLRGEFLAKIGNVNLIELSAQMGEMLEFKRNCQELGQTAGGTGNSVAVEILQADMNDMKTVVNNVKNTLQGVIDIAPGEMLTGYEIRKLKNQILNDDDRYYLQTINIKKFSEPDLTQSSRFSAKKVLRVDGLEDILYEAEKVQFMRAEEEEDRSMSLRLTYPTSIAMGRAMKRIGMVGSELKKKQGRLSLSYNQLTPPRFSKERKKLFEIASKQKKDGLIKSFTFVINKNELMCRTTNTGRAPDIIRLAPVIEPDVDNMETDNEDENTEADEVPANGCSICNVPMEENCSRLECGHAAHGNCLKSYMMVTTIRCPVCRNIPVNVRQSLDCKDCHDDAQSMTDTELESQVRISAKCGHLHLAQCLEKFTEEKFGVKASEFAKQEEGAVKFQNLTNFLLDSCAGCVSCDNNESTINGVLSTIAKKTTDTKRFVKPEGAAFLFYRRGEALEARTSPGSGNGPRRQRRRGPGRYGGPGGSQSSSQRMDDNRQRSN